MRSVPLVVGFDSDPAFMGCSVGGLLALDLAQRHPEIFKGDIIEGSLNIEGDRSASKRVLSSSCQ